MTTLYDFDKISAMLEEAGVPKEDNKDPDHIIVRLRQLIELRSSVTAQIEVLIHENQFLRAMMKLVLREWQLTSPDTFNANTLARYLTNPDPDSPEAEMLRQHLSLLKFLTGGSGDATG